MKKLNKNGLHFDSKKKFFTSSKRNPISEMDCYNCGELGHLAHQCLIPTKDKYRKKNKEQDDSSDDEKNDKKPYKKKGGKKKEYHKKKNGKAYIVGDWLTDNEAQVVTPPATKVMMRRLPPLPLMLHHHHLHHHLHPLHTYASWSRVTGRYKVRMRLVSVIVNLNHHLMTNL